MNKLKQIISLLIITGLFSTNVIKAQTNQDREIESIANQLVQQISTTDVKNVAIADFANLDGTYSQLGKYLAEEFSFALTSIDKNFNIIDRSKVNYLLKEAGLASDGLVDPNTIAKLGNMKGIDAIVSGSLTPQGNNMRIFIKVLQLETASVLASVRGDISLNPDIIAMSGNGLSASSNTKTNTSKTIPKKDSNNGSEFEKVLGNIIVKITEVKKVRDKLVVNYKLFNDTEKLMEVGLYSGNNSSKSTYINIEGDIIFSDSGKIGAKTTSQSSRRYISEHITGKSWVNGAFEFSNIGQIDMISNVKFHFYFKNKGKYDNVDFIVQNVPISK